MWLLIPILFYSIIYLYIRHIYSHWKRKGFPSERAGFNWKFLKHVYRREFHYVDAVNEAYQLGRDQVLYGIYFFFKPILLVRDLGLARIILENSCGNFNNVKWDYVKDYKKINSLEKLASIFTQTRVEGMFRNIEKVADYMVNHLQKISIEHEAITLDLQHLMRIYSMNVIGNLVYGLEINNFEQTDCIFMNYLCEILRNHKLNSYTLNRLPKKSSLTYRLRDIIKEGVEKREEGGYIKKDVLQLLVKFRNGNDLSNSAKQNWHIENVFAREKVLSVKKLSKITEEFLNIGVETTASAMVFTLYEVLQEPNMVEKLMQEINCMSENKENEYLKLNFVDLDSLTYLDLCIQETLRKYPAVPIIERVCRKNFNIPRSRYTIYEGKSIMIPLMSIQRDEKYYDDPCRYNPERFIKSSKGTNKYKEAFIGFGISAGACVAQNFSKCVIKLAVVKLLQNFNIELCDKNAEIVYQPSPVIKNGFKVKLEKREIKTKFYL